MLTLLLMLCFAADEGIYGAAVKAETPLITIAEFAAHPQKYLNKVVKVEGVVQEVCPKAGCWLTMKEGDDEVKIKVKDGEIVFDAKLIGKKVVAEGTVYSFQMDHEQAIEYYRHLAEEKNEPFDPKTVTGPVTIYQIGGIGVQIK
ncbi:MAG: DUF4920 domain-containing protein [Acidobacteriota bacterium]|nr:DUF4920 domain-containing protein [Acidobacteriota bacterium]